MQILMIHKNYILIMILLQLGDILVKCHSTMIKCECATGSCPNISLDSAFSPTSLEGNHLHVGNFKSIFGW